jgi:hypothetical protein
MACAARGRFCNSAAGLFLTVRQVLEKQFRKRMIENLIFVNSAEGNGKRVQKAHYKETAFSTVRKEIEK